MDTLTVVIASPLVVIGLFLWAFISVIALDIITLRKFGLSEKFDRLFTRRS